MNADSADHLAAIYQRASALHQQGRIHEARAAYERVLSLRPQEVSALTMLGLIAVQSGDLATALGHLDSAVRLSASNRSSDGSLHYYRGHTLLQLRRFESAISSYEQTIAIGQNLVAEAYYERGFALVQLERHQPAVESFDHALARGFKAVADVYFARGVALAALARPELAINSYERVLREVPGHVPALLNLGRLQRDLGSLEPALIAYQGAFNTKPDLVEAWINAGEVLWALGRAEEAEAIWRRGLESNPSCAALHGALGMALAGGGDIEAALQSYRRALAIHPDDPATHSNLIFSLMFASESHEPMLAESRRFNARFASALSRQTNRSHIVRSGRPRLRIGYVSPDFRDHCQSLFTLPLFEHHDRSAFEIYCYSTTRYRDDVTTVIGQRVDAFRDVSALGDDALADRVRADGIDVLVDLAMHMAHGRPLMFARRPAPVQIAWLAYPGTTGIETIDFRFSDPRLDPAEYDGHYTERTLRLPDAFWCYDPRSKLSPATLRPERGELTLGCFNNPCKLTDRTLRLWSPVLTQLPHARLLLLVPAGHYRRDLLRRADAVGIDTTRIEFVAHCPRDEYLGRYRDVDFCLDTFPYNGHTTSLDALWMGVPFVTRTGTTSVGRGGLSLLFQLGLTELATESDEQFAAVALALAGDPARLETLRLELRSRLESSPLMDGCRFARNVEAAYRSAMSSAGL